jgi:hypothetical protein
MDSSKRILKKDELIGAQKIRKMGVLAQRHREQDGLENQEG